MLRIRSFKAQLLIGAVVGYLALWIIFGTVSILSFKRDVEQIVTSHVRWLSLYASTLIPDLQVGNTLATERKLNVLVNKDVFTKATLRFGTTELSVERNGNLGTLSNRWTWVAKALIPQQQISVKVLDTSNTVWGDITASLDSNFILRPLADTFFRFAGLGSALFFISLGVLMLWVEQQAQPLSRLTRYIRKFSKVGYDNREIEALLAQPVRFPTNELQALHQEFKLAVENLLVLQETLRKQKVDAEIAKIALQVAHDIRSPLTALTMIGEKLEALPESERLLIIQSTNRIIDIANDLLERFRKDKNKATPPVLSAELISSLLEAVVSETRLKLSNGNIDLSLHLTESNYGLFAKVHNPDFKRLTSNIIQNAIEALDDNGGKIHIFVEKLKDSLKVIIEDNGKGIPKEVLEKIRAENASYGKRSGHGLGLKHARECLEQWGGSLELESIEGVGTKVILLLPIETTPDWFLSKLVFSSKTNLLILDDDPAIHNVWKVRLEHFLKNKSLASCNHFYKSQDLIDWFSSQDKENKKFLLLVDYELIGSELDGIQVVEKIEFQKRAVLVTNRHEDLTIKEKASKLEVPFIPKSMAPFVPMEWNRFTLKRKLDARDTELGL